MYPPTFSNTRSQPTCSARSLSFRIPLAFFRPKIVPLAPQTHSLLTSNTSSQETQKISFQPKIIKEEKPNFSAKMSWQTYVDDHLLCEQEGNYLSAAAIIGHDGSVWAQSASFPQLKPEEITGIMKDLDEPGSLAPTGLYLGGTKYMVIQGEPGAVIRGKKGAGGVTIKKTSQALIIGIYDEPMTPGQCNMVVERLGDYLIEQGL